MVSVNEKVIIAFNAFLAIGGLAIIILASIVQQNLDEYEDINYWHMEHSAIVLITGGVLLLVTSIIGMAGAVKGTKIIMFGFTALLVASAILLLAGAIIGFVYIQDTESELNTYLVASMRNTTLNNDFGTKADKDWDTIQQDFECCGVNKSTDWNTYASSAPPNSCKCKKDEDNNCPTDGGNFDKGCLPAIMDFIYPLVMAASILGVIYAFFSLIGVALGFLFIKSSKRKNINA